MSKHWLDNAFSRRGYLWAAGHTASGMMQAPGTAAVLTDLVLNRPPTLPIHQLSVERHIGHL